MFAKGLRNSTTSINADNMKTSTIATSKISANLRLSEEIPLSTRFENKSIHIELTDDKDVNSKFNLTFTPIKEDDSNDTQTIMAKVIKYSGTKSFRQELELVKVDKDITIRKFIEDYQILKIFEIKLVKLNDGTNIVAHDQSSSDIIELQNSSNKKIKKINHLKQRFSKLENKCKESDLLVFVKLFKDRESLKNAKEKLKINEKLIEKIKYCQCEKDPLTFQNVKKDININNINTMLKEITRNTTLAEQSSNTSDSDSDIEIVENKECKINLYKNPQNKTELELAKHKYIILRELCKFNTDKYSNSEQVSAHINKARKALFNLTKFKIDPVPFSIPAVEAFSNICKESHAICKELRKFGRGKYKKKRKQMKLLTEFVTNLAFECDLSDDLTNELSANEEKLSINFKFISKDLDNYQLIDTQFPIYNQPNYINTIPDNSNQLKNTDAIKPATLNVNLQLVKVEEIKDVLENEYLQQEVALQNPITTLKEKSTNTLDVNKTESKVGGLFKSLGQKLKEFDNDSDTESDNSETVNNFTSDFKFFSSSTSSSESEFEEFQFPKKEPVYTRITKNEYKCIKCDKIITNAMGITAHYNLHLEKSTLCHKCGLIFETRTKLNSHYSVCSKEFNKNGEDIDVDKPIAVRRGRPSKDTSLKPCLYKNCSSMLHDDYRYYEHQNSHTGEKPYKCSCGKTFSKSFYFYAHFNRPSNKNEKNCIMDNCKLPHYAPAGNYTFMENFRCGSKGCNKSFQTNFKLLEHAYAHTGEKLYYCSCGLNYRYLASLTNHIKDSKCSPTGCIYPDYVDPRSLTRRGIRGKRKLIKEINLNENNPSPSNIENKIVKRPRAKNPDLYCPICNIKFPNYDKYRHHKIRHAERKYACQGCKRAYQTLALLNEHKKVHLDKMFCKICNKLFIKRSLYKLHLERHNNKGTISITERKKIRCIYDCKICFNQFKCSKKFTEHFSDKNHKTKEIDWLKNTKITKMSCHLCSDVTFSNFYEACHHYGDFHRQLRNVLKYIYKENGIKDENTCITKSYKSRSRNKKKNINDDATLPQLRSKDCTSSTEKKDFVNYQPVDIQFPIYRQSNNVNVTSDNSNQLKNTDVSKAANLEVDVEFVKVEEFKDHIENDYLPENNKKEELALLH